MANNHAMSTPQEYPSSPDTRTEFQNSDNSHGYYEDLWELAVLNFGDGDDKGHIDYSTPITDDVKGCLTDKVVRHTLGEIKGLPR